MATVTVATLNLFNKTGRWGNGVRLSWTRCWSCGRM